MAKENRFVSLLGIAPRHPGLFDHLGLPFCRAVCITLSRFEPDFPQYLDHIQERLTPILQAVRQSSPSIERLGAWLNPGNSLQVSIRGPSFVEMALKNTPKFLAILVVVHVLAFFLLLYGARLLKKLVDMILGVSEKQNVVEIASEIEQNCCIYVVTVRGAAGEQVVYVNEAGLIVPAPVTYYNRSKGRDGSASNRVFPDRQL